MEEIAGQEPGKPADEPTSGQSIFSTLDKRRLGKALKFLRQTKGFSQKQLADRIGASQAFVFQFERGESGISWDMLNRIGAALEIPSSWIIFIFSPDDAPGISTELKEQIKATKERLLNLISQSVNVAALKAALVDMRSGKVD